MGADGKTTRSRLVAKVIFAFAVILTAAASPVRADSSVIRVGVLKFGTVSWELDVMRRHGLDRAEGVNVAALELAGKDSAAVALQGGAVDVILTDWLWVARRRGLGGDFTFAPHSHAAGGLIVRSDAGIKGLADLKGRRIGVAGGPIDKSWLILRAYAKKAAGLDLVGDAEPVFAAPPLLTETLRQGDLPAALNFWQYNARLPAAGYIELIRVEDMLAALDVAPETPLLGWVFSERWADTHKAALQGFLRAAAAARSLLARSPEEWRAIAPLAQIGDPDVLERLRLAYARGISGEVPGDLPGAAQHLLDLLMSFGGIDEAPPNGRVPPGTFFAGAP